MNKEVTAKVDKTPQIYSADETHLFLDWIAEGTDGILYRVPSEPGGWRRRERYSGDRETLKAVPVPKARAIVQFIGGQHTDWGNVIVAEGLSQVEGAYYGTGLEEVSTP